MNERSITLSLSAETLERFCEKVKADELYRAIGYLSIWNMDYPKVNIMPESDTDLLAVYLDAAGHTHYVIGAVWHGDHYGFHS